MNGCSTTPCFSKPTLVVTNALRVENIRGRLVSWLIHEVGEPNVTVIAPQLSIHLFSARQGHELFCDFQNEAELLQTIQSAWQKRRCILLVPVVSENYPPGFCGVPPCLEKLQGIDFQCVPLWYENQWEAVFENWGFGLQTTEQGRRTGEQGKSMGMGAAIPDEPGWVERARSALLALGYEASMKHAELKMHLGRVALSGLKKNFNRVVVADTRQKKSLTGGDLMAAGIGLAWWMKKKGLGRRIGIVLPPSAGAIIANLACVLADRVPVNLNFTAGRAANEAAIAQSGIQSMITAEAMAQKLPDFPWGDRKVDLTEALRSLPKIKLGFWKLMARMLSPRTLGNWLALPEEGGDAELALLFTSGSSGAPKGVVLSHRNMLANVAQFSALLPVAKIDSILGCLPIFHSFGFTVTLWWPLLGGPCVATYPSALEVVHLADIVAEHQVKLMVTTPTFLRAFVRRVEPAKLASLKLVVTGAEKLPLNLLDEFEKKFGVRVCEGYGMTEGSPVATVNRVSWYDPRAESCERRVGSVGRLVPGLQVRTVSLESGEIQASTQTGLLHFKGPNIFPGYLNAPEPTAAVLQDGWYVSGDIGRLDEDGFLWIEGRQSRFSKIGGEMVAHAVIEQKVEAICHAHGEAEARAVVMGVRDEAKGEKLVLLTTSSLPPETFRSVLAETGLPNLWIPRKIHHVDAIPTLASGKLDLKECQKLADGT